MTLVGKPDVMFLDEPTSGLDPRSRRTMWDIVRELAAAGTTVFLTTQYLEEADQLADRVAVLDNGRLVGEGSPAELKRVIPGGHVELRLSNPSALEAAAALLDDRAPNVDSESLVIRVPTDGTVTAVRALLNRLEGHSVAVESVSVRTADLDDVFFGLTGHPQAAPRHLEEPVR